MSDLICYDDQTRLPLERARSIFNELPALRLPRSQLQRLLGSTPRETTAILDRLVAQRFLTQSADGYFGRTEPMQPFRLRHIGAIQATD